MHAKSLAEAQEHENIIRDARWFLTRRTKRLRELWAMIDDTCVVGNNGVRRLHLPPLADFIKQCRKEFGYERKRTTGGSR